MPGNACCGSGGADGAASETRNITINAAAPSAAEMANASAAAGRAPVLCAEFLYARRRGVMWTLSAAALAHGPFE